MYHRSQLSAALSAQCEAMKLEFSRTPEAGVTYLSKLSLVMLV